MAKLLITGASGFVGRAAVAALGRQGHQVRAAMRRPPVPPFPGGIDVVQHADLAQPFDWRAALDGIDAVIHLAGIARTGRDIAPDRYDQVNCRATAELARTAALAGVTRFVFVSSIQAQTGPAADHALTERDPPQPMEAYGRSKLAAEEAVRTAGVPFTILRPVLLYGPGAKGNFALLWRAAASPWPLPLKSFGNRRSLLGIDNLMSALTFVLATPGTVDETYVVADPGIPPRLSDVIAILRKARGRWPLLVPLPLAFVEFALRLVRRPELWDRLGGNLRVDPGKLIAAGWHPLHDTPSGLVKLARAEPAP